MSANGLHRIRRRWVVLTRVHRTRCVSVCETFRKFYGNVKHVEGLENVGKRTPSEQRMFFPHGFKNDLYFIVAHLLCLMAERTTYILRVAFVSPHGLKNDECYMCWAHVLLYGLKNDECYTCSALVSPHDYKNDVYFMCSALVSPNGLKNDECYMCSALVSRHDFKNDVYFMCSACFASWLRDIFSVSGELTSRESDRLLPRRTVSIRSDQVCLPTSSTPLAPVNLLLPVPLTKRLAPIPGSGQNRTQSASW